MGDIMGHNTASEDRAGDTRREADRVEGRATTIEPDPIDRRGVLRLGATASLGISALSLPLSAASASVGPDAGTAPAFIVDDGGTIGTDGVTHLTIQSAVNDASNGERIEVRSGTYAEQVVTGTKNLDLVGDGAATTVIVGSITFGSTVGTAAVLTGVSSRVQGFAFKRPDAVLSTDSTYKMVAARGNGHSLTIAGCTFDLQAGAADPVVRGRGAALSGTATWTVTGNTFQNQTYASAYESRLLFFENAGPSVIHDNEFDLRDGHTIFLTGTQPGGTQITSNRFVRGQSITLGTPAGVTIQGNDFEGGTVVYLDSNPGAVIRNNRFTSAVIFFVGPTVVAEFTENDISFAGYSGSTPPFGGNTVFNAAASGGERITLDASGNWWGKSDAPTTVAGEGDAPYDSPVIVEPRIFSFELGAAPSGFRTDRGFWATDITPPPAE